MLHDLCTTDARLVYPHRPQSAPLPADNRSHSTLKSVDVMVYEYTGFNGGPDALAGYTIEIISFESIFVNVVKCMRLIEMISHMFNFQIMYNAYTFSGVYLSSVFTFKLLFIYFSCHDFLS
jgi:hypothetical protein